jgi:UDP-glucose 4-epimerase
MPTKTARNILIVGGAGYIGSHMIHCVKRAGYIPVVLDNFSTGHRDVVKGHEFVEGDIHDKFLLEKVFAERTYDAVLHFASFIQVAESVSSPFKYYYNNVAGTLTLLEAMLAANVKYFIFSSTAAVYGNPIITPINESHPLAPINPYGRGKWMVEQILQDLTSSHDLKYSVLRYFNAAGSDYRAGLSERHDPETHLIPIVLQAASGVRKAVTVYGNDYPTADGTCIRDYIHVNDICDAHLLALQALWAGAANSTYNLGTGRGYSVKEVIQTARQVTGCAIRSLPGKRRQGDPAVLVADATAIYQDLGWQTKCSTLETIIEQAWAALISAEAQ